MIVQVNHMLRLKYGRWLDVRHAGQVGWGSGEQGLATELLGSTAILKLRALAVFLS